MTRQVRLSARQGTGQTIILQDGTQVIGRGESCDHVLAADSVSTEHCRIDCSGGMIVLRDLRSTNGSHVNGQAVTRTVLDPGDRVQIGTFQFEVEIVAVESAVEPPSDFSTATPKKDGQQDDSIDAMLQTLAPEPEANTQQNQKPQIAQESETTTERPQPGVDTSPPPPLAAVAPEFSVDTRQPVPTPALPSKHVHKAKREPRDWSQTTEFLQRNAKSVSALVGLGLLAVLFVVPWARLSVPSDQELCEFYETTLANVIMMRKTGGSPADWDDFASQAISQNSEYVAHLDVQGLSPSARVLLIAGRDYLEKMFTESRTERSSTEQMYHQKVASVRALIGGPSLVEDYEDPEAIAKRKADNAAAQEALSEMFGT